MAIVPVTRKHAAKWPGSGKRGSGTVRRQSAVHWGQRAARSCGSGGRRRKSGGLPEIASMSRSRGWPCTVEASKARAICRGGRGPAQLASAPARRRPDRKSSRSSGFRKGVAGSITASVIARNRHRYRLRNIRCQRHAPKCAVAGPDNLFAQSRLCGDLLGPEGPHFKTYGKSESLSKTTGF